MDSSLSPSKTVSQTGYSRIIGPSLPNIATILNVTYQCTTADSFDSWSIYKHPAPMVVCYIGRSSAITSECKKTGGEVHEKCLKLTSLSKSHRTVDVTYINTLVLIPHLALDLNIA